MKWHKVLAENENIHNPRPNKRYFEQSGYTEEQYKEAREHYWQVEMERYRMLKNAMLEDAGLFNHPKAEKIWDYAYDQGHSSGWENVWFHLEELAGIVL